MSEPDQVLSEFVDAWNAGRRPRVDDYLARVDPAHRDDLAERLGDWLAMAPTPAYDEAALASIREEPALQAALAAVREEAALWPEVLPRLRERAGLRVRELAARVTAAFGLAGEEARAEAYLERMERGDLDPSRVSRRLLEALGAALGVPGEQLERAGGGRPGGGAAALALFRADRDAAASFAEDLEVLAAAASAPAPPPMDELDRLFLGGRDA